MNPECRMLGFVPGEELVLSRSSGKQRVRDIIDEDAQPRSPSLLAPTIELPGALPQRPQPMEDPDSTARFRDM